MANPSTILVDFYCFYKEHAILYAMFVGSEAPTYYRLAGCRSVYFMSGTGTTSQNCPSSLTWPIPVVSMMSSWFPAAITYVISQAGRSFYAISPIGWTGSSSAPIGQLFRSQGCASSMPRLTAQRYLNLWFWPTIVFFLLASYWLDIIYLCSHWSIVAGCPGARQRVLNQRHGHRYRDTQVPDPVLPLFFPYSPPIGWTIFTPAPIGQLL
jgi:hypothetical protein